MHAARLLRTVAAAHANSGLDEAHPIELDIAEDALNAVVLGDERLLTRAVENAISNARLPTSPRSKRASRARARRAARLGRSTAITAWGSFWSTASPARTRDRSPSTARRAKASP